MFILENEFVQRFRICVHLVSLLMVSVRAAPQNRNIVMELKQLSTSMAETLNESVKGINPLIPSPKIRPNLNNLSYAGKPTEVTVSSSYSNFRTSAKVNVNTQDRIKDSFDAPVVFPDRKIPSGTDSDGWIGPRSPIVNQPKIKKYASIDAIIERCQKNATAGTFCEIAADYPTSLTDNILKNLTARMAFGQYFSNDTLIVENLQTKTDFEPEYRPLCPSTESIRYLSIAKNIEEKFKLIIQTSDLRQGIRVEICQDTNSSCELINNISTGYKSKCVQKYMLRKLVTETKNQNGELLPILDDFRIPSCCACKYIESYEDVMRSSGLGPLQSTKPTKKQRNR